MKLRREKPQQTEPPRRRYTHAEAAVIALYAAGVIEAKQVALAFAELDRIGRWNDFGKPEDTPVFLRQ